MKEFLFNFINQYGYFAMFLLIFLENVIPPIPSMVLLPFAGYMTFSTTMNPWGIIFYTTLGSMFGAVVLYYIGYIIPVYKLEKLCDSKFGKILRLKKENLYKAIDWFTKRGTKTVFYCRFIPIVRSIISIPAGITRINTILFLILTLIGTFIWNVFFVFLGVFLKDYSITLITVVSNYCLVIVLILMVLIILYFVYKHYKNKK